MTHLCHCVVLILVISLHYHLLTKYYIAMKKFLFVLFILGFIFSCGKDDDTSSDPFKGEDLTASKTIGKVGNYWDLKTRGWNISGKVSVTTNDNGVTTFEADMKNIEDQLGEISYKGEKISGDSPMIFRAKISTNTIATFDYGSTDDKDPFVLVKFDGKKGDKYTHTDNGKITVREIVNDEFEVEAYGWIIKAFQIDETLPSKTLMIKKGGAEYEVTKITYLVNHRFGPVNIQFYANGGSFPLIIIDGLNTNCDTKG